ncbi:MAG TPA: hypothetical protein VNA22_01570 [Pyrinomonadaceae bacterium]|nr:hypothetical protein [Pyrinomonadaceae bacterium]
MKRRTLIATRTETVERVFVANLPRVESVPCASCDGSTWLGFVASRMLSGLTFETLGALAESGEIHTTQDHNGNLLICSQSLANALPEE